MRIGLCGFTIAMDRYPRHYPLVEVQQTFYRPPAEAVMRRWRAAMPAGFFFTLKAWQFITHPAASPTYRRLGRPLTDAERAQAGAFRDTPVVDHAWQVTAACAATLQASAILFQCPASFKPSDANIGNLLAFFRRIDRPAGVHLLWEPRGP